MLVCLYLHAVGRLLLAFAFCAWAGDICISKWVHSRVWVILVGRLGVRTNSNRLNIDFIAPFFRYDHPQQRVRIWPSMEVGLKQRKCVAINAMCGWRWLGFAIPLEGDRKRGNDEFQSHALNTRNQWGCTDMKYLECPQTTLGKNIVSYRYKNLFF